LDHYSRKQNKITRGYLVVIRPYQFIIMKIRTLFLYLLLLYAGKSFSQTAKHSTIYCLKITDKINPEGTQRALYPEHNNYQYLFKLDLDGNGNVKKYNKYRDLLFSGKYEQSSSELNVFNKERTVNDKFKIILNNLPYMTLQIGDKTYYCFVD
jgi:hypothetical protein